MQHLAPVRSTSTPEDECVIERRSNSEGHRKGASHRVTILTLLFLALAVWYGFKFWQDLAPYWFHPEWTTDDALQQAAPFQEVIHPGIFQGDLINEVMVGYLAPLHYWICYGITYLTGSPVMMCHWVMLIQIALTLGFMFLAVRKLSSVPAALFAVTWFLHTRPVMQRITSGLPRGWSAFVLIAAVYFMSTRRQVGVHLILIAGCLLHPPAAMVAALAYGMYLVACVVLGKERDWAKKALLVLILTSPVYCLVTWNVVKKPAHIGEMVDFKTASSMPEFQRPYGRFPFLPLESIWDEVRMYGYQPFGHRLFNPGRTMKVLTPWAVGIAFLGLLVWGAQRKREVIPLELFTLFGAIVIVYLASRALAFKLYVPNRHLQMPMTVFLIAAFSVGIWRAFYQKALSNSMYSDARIRSAWGSALALVLLSVFVVGGTGDGLYGAGNFNYSLEKKGKVFRYVRKATPVTALIAGHPSHIDALSLFGERKVYATTETAHPFYPTYYAEIKRRLIISFRSHFATSMDEFLTLLEPERIDYFVFSSERFTPGGLTGEDYFHPLDTMVKELASKPRESYLFSSLPKASDPDHYPFVVFRDRQSVVVDVQKLLQNRRKELPAHVS